MTKKRDPELVDRDQQILSRLARIEHKVDSLEQTTAFALRAEDDKHRESVRAIFKNGLRRAQVYLAVDGSRTVQSIATHLGMTRQGVGRELAVLKVEGLLELTDSDGAGDVYSKKPVDHTLRISRYLCDAYGLATNGKPAASPKGKKPNSAKGKKAKGAKPR